MRTPLVLLAGLALALAPAQIASGKEISSVKACGADGCRDVTSLAVPAIMEGGPPASAPDHAAPFHRLEITMRAGKDRVRLSSLYVPSAHRLRGDDGTWMSPPAASLRALDRLVSGGTPLPASGLGLPRAEAPAGPPPARADAGLSPAVWVLLAGTAVALLAGAAGVIRITFLRRRGAASTG